MTLPLSASTTSFISSRSPRPLSVADLLTCEWCELSGPARDYLVRESKEVLAHAEWLESRDSPQLFFSLHEDWESTGFYFYEINLGEDCPERATAIIDAVRAYFPPEPEALIDDHETRAPGWIYHAADADLPNLWPEAIFLAKRGCPLSFTLETPSSGPLEDRIAAHVAAVKAAHISCS